MNNDLQSIKDRVLNAVWNSPETFFGFEFDSNQCAKYRLTDLYGNFEKCTKGKFKLFRGSSITGKIFGGTMSDQTVELFELAKNKYNTDFLGALKKLCDLYGIPYELTEAEKKRAKMQTFNGLIMEYCSKILAEQSRAQSVREYLARRGLKPSERLGYWDKSVKNEVCNLIEKQFADITRKDIESRVGQLFPYFDKDERGQWTDRSDDYRLIIGRYNGKTLIDFCGRWTSAEPTDRKYKYSLTGDEVTENKATGAYIKTEKQQFVCEGMLDFETAIQYGVENIVATGLSTIGDNLIDKLFIKGVREIVIIPDNETDDKDNAPRKLETLQTSITDRANRKRYRFTASSIDNILKYNKGIDEAERIKISVSDIRDWRTDWDEVCKDINDFCRAHQSDDLRTEILDGKKDWYIYLADGITENATEPSELGRQIQRIYNGIEDYAERKRFARTIDKEIADGIRQDKGKNLTFEEQSTGAKLDSAGIGADIFAQIDKRGVNGTKQSLADKYIDEIKEAQKQADFDGICKGAKRLQSLEHRESANAIFSQLRASRESIEKDIAQRGQETVIEDITLQDDEDRPVRKLAFAPVGVSVFVAPPKHGKTTILQDMAVRLARQGDGIVLFFTMEQTTADILTKQYIYCAQGIIQDTPHGLTPYIENAIKESAVGVKRCDDLKLIREKHRQTFANIFSARLNDSEIDTAVPSIEYAVEQYRRQGESIKAVIIDYLQLFTHGSGSIARTEQLAHVVKRLNDLSNDLNISIITACQFNREARSIGLDEIGTAQIGESKSIENYATDIYMLLNAKMIKYQLAPDEDKINEGKEDKASRRGKRILSCRDSADKECRCIYIENLISRRHETGGYACLELDRFGVITKQL